MRRFLYLAVAFAVLTTGVSVSSARAAPPHAVKTVRVMVQLRGQPLAADRNLKARNRETLYRYRLDPALPKARAYTNALQSYQRNEIEYLKAHGIDLSVGRLFQTLFNGFAATVPAQQLWHLRRLANVIQARPEARFYPLLDHSLPLVGTPEAWTELGGQKNAGQGLIIAEIDTGIDINHPCFNDAGMPTPPLRRADSADNLKLTNNKVIVARAFGGDRTRSYSAEDQFGHGTFGGAIEACDAGTETPLHTQISGLAPRAYLENLNVFPQGGGTLTEEDPIVAALESALFDHADVVNMSIGSVLGSGDARLDPWQLEVKMASAAGLTVVVSAGNAGPAAQSTSTPAASPEAIAVGATSNSHAIYSSVSVVGPGAVPDGLSKIKAKQTSHPLTADVAPAQMIYVGLARRPDDDSTNPTADDLAGKDLQGKIAVIDRGIFKVDDKLNNVSRAGAVGAVIIDNRPEPSLPGFTLDTATLPAETISQSDGGLVLNWLRQHPDAQMSLSRVLASYETVPNVLSDFSSVGYTSNYTIKPDLVAPGQDIYSATESKHSDGEMYNPTGYTSESGTSFSAPHITGAVALLLQKHRNLTPAMVKAVLMETASRDIYVDTGHTKLASVMQAGAGLLDIGAALAAPAYLSPPSESFGEMNVAEGENQRNASLTLNDIDQGAGTWQISIDQTKTNPGLQIGLPSSVDLPAGGHVDIAAHISASASTPTGDYEGAIVLTRGAMKLHVPYFIHIVQQAIRPFSVLLVDATTSRFQQPDPSGPPVVHRDVTRWFEQALTDIGKPYTYWDEATLGTPSLTDLSHASSVIYFSGSNLNGWGPQNRDPQSLLGALGPTDVTNLHAYLDLGGKLFITGAGALLSDLDWTGIVLGAGVEKLSVYDDDSNDKKDTGGIPLPQPSAAGDGGSGTLSHVGPFLGLKPFDLSDKGDGANDAEAIKSEAVGSAVGDQLGDLVGVLGMQKIKGSYGFQGKAYGQAAITTLGSNKPGQYEVGIVSSDEPSLSHKTAYPGRTVAFSFPFESINDNTGYATRAQVLKRVYDWLYDYPSVTVSSKHFKARKKVKLQAKLQAPQPAKAGQFVWQIGSKKLSPTDKTASYRFPHPGKYKIRVQVTDTLGHVAVSAWVNVAVS